MFTDIVGSSQLASDIGDRRWRVIQARHNTVVRRELRRFGGYEVDTAEDGFFATFETPADAMPLAALNTRT
jgi:class 3 adenylate cyclase